MLWHTAPLLNMKGGVFAEYTREELLEARRQIDSTLHKLGEVIKTFESKDNPQKYQSQITLVKRRINAFSIANDLTGEKLAQEK